MIIIMITMIIMLKKLVRSREGNLQFRSSGGITRLPDVFHFLACPFVFWVYKCFCPSGKCCLHAALVVVLAVAQDTFLPGADEVAPTANRAVTAGARTSFLSVYSCLSVLLFPMPSSLFLLLLSSLFCMLSSPPLCRTPAVYYFLSRAFAPAHSL